LAVNERRPKTEAKSREQRAKRNIEYRILNIEACLPTSRTEDACLVNRRFLEVDEGRPKQRAKGEGRRAIN
jgi:hypothetical protein